MSVHVGNQNVGFLMTRLIFSDDMDYAVFTEAQCKMVPYPPKGCDVSEVDMSSIFQLPW